MSTDRSKYIGSSDARHILAGDWDRIWRRKTGREGETAPSFAMKLGQVVEDLHLDYIIDDLGSESWQASKGPKADEQHYSEFTPEGTYNAPPIGSHPDCLFRHQSNVTYPGEVKITGRWKSVEEALDWYMPQLQHHMLAWGADQILFSVILGTSEPERAWVGASEEWQHHYIDRCDSFWAHVKSDIAPPPLMPAQEGKPIVPTKVKDSVPIDGMKKRSLEGDNHASVLIPEFISTKRAAKRHEEVKKELKEMMADDERELYHPALVLKRNKAGSILFTVKDEEFGQDKAA